MVKNILTKKDNNSTPGDDGILYGFLVKLPSAHHFLATLYNKIDESCIAPTMFGSSRIILTHNNGPQDSPNNFCMIAHTNVFRNIYHQIKAKRLSDFMVLNNYIDKNTQRPFLKGINWFTEHVEVMKEMIQDAKNKRSSVHVSWYDQENAFGSERHDQIVHCLS